VREGWVADFGGFVGSFGLVVGFLGGWSYGGVVRLLRGVVL